MHSKLLNITYNAKLNDGDTFTEQYNNIEDNDIDKLLAECHRRAIIKSYIVGYEIKVEINR